MNTVKSADGTHIAYDKLGSGPAVILVTGAMTSRSAEGFVDLAKLLSQKFTVYNYDRRGRGDSGDTPPFSVRREIEDIEALIDDAGVNAGVYGHSSGASLALEAALALPGKIQKVALYEAPYNDDPDARLRWGEYQSKLKSLLAEGRKGDAAAAFMQIVGVPAEQIEGMRNSPMWDGIEAITPTLAYDHGELLANAGSAPLERSKDLRVPALVMYGETSFPFMKTTAELLSGTISDSRLVGVPGQTHDVEAKVLAPILAGFFSA